MTNKFLWSVFRSKETSLRGQKHLKSVSLVVDMMSFSQKIVIFALVLMLCYEIQAVPGPCWDWLCLRGCSFIRGKSEGYCDDDDNCMWVIGYISKTHKSCARLSCEKNPNLFNPIGQSQPCSTCLVQSRDWSSGFKKIRVTLMR